MTRYTLAAVAALLILAPWHESARAQAPLYTVHNLGDVAGEVPAIVGVNNNGQVVGNVSTNGSMAVRYTNGAWETLPGLDTAFSSASGINKDGDVVGYYQNPLGQFRAFRYSDHYGLQEIAPVAGGRMTFGYGINDAGDVVGLSDGSLGLVAFLAKFGADPVALPGLNGRFAQGCGINAAGQAVGFATTATGAQHGFRVDANATTAVDISSFDGPGGTVTTCAIDADGRIGGQAVHGGLFHAFLFSDTAKVDIDTFADSSESNVESIAGGVAAGWYTPAAGQRAFAHTDADGSFDLNTRVDAAGWVLQRAKGVTANGVIAGEGTFNNVPAAFLLTPSAADTTPPVIAAHGDETAEATGSYGANVFYTAPATADAVDGAGTAACTPASGSTFALGTTIVTCNATDAAGNAATPTTFKVIVTDTTAPVIGVHGDVTAEAAGPNGASVAYDAPPTTDAFDGSRASTCAPASGSTFALGSTTVTCNATDAAGNAAVPTTFKVVVTDSTAPAIAAHGDVAAEATGANGASVAYSAPATTDAVGGNGTATCAPVSGSTFALGSTTVTCNATDAAGNAATATTFKVTVRDTTAPVIAAHANVTAAATSAAGASVVYTLPATTDAVGGNGTAACAPASGSTFPIGTSTVTCNAGDAAGNAAVPTTFKVVVEDATAPLIASLSTSLASIWPANGKWIAVSVSVSASDDVDAAPVCALSAVSGGPASDVVVTGSLSARVRAVRNADGSTRVYLFEVSCHDAAGNASTAAVSVSVSKDEPQKVYHYNTRLRAFVVGLLRAAERRGW